MKYRKGEYDKRKEQSRSGVRYRKVEKDAKGRSKVSYRKGE